ncbi:hypothetical protein BRC81_06835 [Halobacteriales archaeon QS_1_68_20]|nr:MAG: hypothetical protein BRC81_06835 [Halobacteriales archaeon QS_1_68_20]
MTDEESRSLLARVLPPVRFVVGFLTANARTLVVDALVIVAWVVGLSLAFGLTRWPLLAYYASLVGGIVVYTLVRDPLVVPGE